MLFRSSLNIRNDQRLFGGKLEIEVRSHRWPGDEKVNAQKYALNPADTVSMVGEFPVPAGARKGQLYTIIVDIYIGTRRVGYLTMPVWYHPTPPSDGPRG